MTERQAAVMEYLSRYQADHGYAPTTREIAKAVGLAESSVRDYLERLERDGHILRAPGIPRAIRLRHSP